ncbi:MAG: type I methionyl aminopeptidase [Thermodesulfobacteriota bacterium]
MSSSIILKTPAEVEILREANQIVAGTLAMLKERMEPGVTTQQIDRWAEKNARKQNAVPAFKGYKGFPGNICISLNEEVVHGIASKKVKLKDGDIVSIDFGVKYKGFHGDAAITVIIGTVSPEVNELISVTRNSLYEGIEQVKVGNRISDISRAVEGYVEKYNFGVVRDFVGHGVGQSLHEPPEIPNYYKKGRSPKLMAGMTIAIEPMVNLGSHEVKVLKDGWTVVTKDGKPSAHFEHSVAVTENGPLILSEGTE